MFLFLFFELSKKRFWKKIVGKCVIIRKEIVFNGIFYCEGFRIIIKKWWVDLNLVLDGNEEIDMVIEIFDFRILKCMKYVYIILSCRLIVIIFILDMLILFFLINYIKKIEEKNVFRYFY